MARVVSVQWRLNPDGGGTVWVTVDHDSHLNDHRHVVDALDELPDSIAEVLLNDGRTEGEWSRGDWIDSSTEQ